MSKPAQLDLVEPAGIFRETVLQKTRGLIPDRITVNLDRCGREEIYRTCLDCGHSKTFYYRCSLKFCPQCNWMISRRRAELLGAWVKRISQPKHLVLTRRNFPVLTRSKIREHHLAIAKMRRSKLWDNVKGGCASTEITNENNGWHLHTHFLLDVRWMDMEAVSIEWGRRVGQEFAIVKIKDVRGSEYLGEVTKYVVKPAELARWPGEQIAEFIHAIRRIRFFATFGTMFKETAKVRAELNMKRPVTVCNCGCSKFRFEDEVSCILREERQKLRRKQR